MKDKTLYRIVSQYCDPTVPGEIIMQTVNEAKDLHEQGKLTFNEECIYDWMRGNVRGKNGAIIGKQSFEATEPEEWEAMDCSQGGIYGEQIREQDEEGL